MIFVLTVPFAMQPILTYLTPLGAVVFAYAYGGLYVNACNMRNPFNFGAKSTAIPIKAFIKRLENMTKAVLLAKSGTISSYTNENSGRGSGSDGHGHGHGNSARLHPRTLKRASVKKHDLEFVQHDAPVGSWDVLMDELDKVQQQRQQDTELANRATAVPYKEVAGAVGK
jgi:hypothetical protein